MRSDGSEPVIPCWSNARSRARTSWGIAANRFGSVPNWVWEVSAFYFVPRGLVRAEELPTGWGLLEHHNRKTEMVRPSKKNLRGDEGFRCEMNLLLASLRRVRYGSSHRP